MFAPRQTIAGSAEEPMQRPVDNRSIFGVWAKFTIAQASLNCFVEVLGMDDQLVVVPRSDGDAAREFDASGQDETVVVIRMFADQIHAPGRAVHGRGVPKHLLEFVG